MFNTITKRQSITDADYRGSYTQPLTSKQFHLIVDLVNKLDVEYDTLWEAFFDEDYVMGNWRSISVNAASEIIENLLTIEKIQKVEQAFLAKIQRTEQEQHEWEMYPDGKL